MNSVDLNMHGSPQALKEVSVVGHNVVIGDAVNPRITKLSAKVKNLYRTYEPYFNKDFLNGLEKQKVGKLSQIGDTPKTDKLMLNHNEIQEIIHEGSRDYDISRFTDRTKGDAWDVYSQNDVKYAAVKQTPGDITVVHFDNNAENTAGAVRRYAVSNNKNDGGDIIGKEKWIEGEFGIPQRSPENKYVKEVEYAYRPQTIVKNGIPTTTRLYLADYHESGYPSKIIELTDGSVRIGYQSASPEATDKLHEMVIEKVGSEYHGLRDTFRLNGIVTGKMRETAEGKKYVPLLSELIPEFDRLDIGLAERNAERLENKRASNLTLTALNTYNSIFSKNDDIKFPYPNVKPNMAESQVPIDVVKSSNSIGSILRRLIEHFRFRF